MGTPQHPTTLEPDAALVAAAQQGDSAAFDRLVARYQTRVYRLMVKMCHHPQDAEEVASEALLRAYQSLQQFEGRSSFITWLGRIASNLCLRRRERPDLAMLSLEEQATRAPERTAHEVAAAAGSPEEAALRQELKGTIQAALQSIPEPDRTVLRLRDIEGWTAPEVSRQTGLTVAAVKARLHRARARLREQLNTYFLS
ncbi:MAG: sigma-70 family RNA polymerase sigma factor [Armatimonadetes bacterium]|nr:sigma-70 family RNA polymerase sigma factor [Armatimonadota bacterium]